MRDTIISRPKIAVLKGTDTSVPTANPAAVLNMSPKIKIKDIMERIAICPPVIFAASRIVNANGFTNMAIISIGIKMK